MYAMLEALEDGVRKIFFFASAEDARRFREFIDSYMLESGAGNGYGAYWVSLDAPIVECRSILSSGTVSLRQDYVQHMLAGIVAARTGDRRATFQGTFLVGTERGAIAFRCDGLPLLPVR